MASSLVSSSVFASGTPGSGAGRSDAASDARSFSSDSWRRRRFSPGSSGASAAAASERRRPNAATNKTAESPRAAGKVHRATVSPTAAIGTAEIKAPAHAPTFRT